MNYLELSKLSVEELRNINQIVVELIKAKRTVESLTNKAGLKVGMKVKVNHPKLKGRELEVVKINRTKANLRVIGGFASYNVPVSLIEY
jgi:transcription antitermination factor NusG